MKKKLFFVFVLLFLLIFVNAQQKSGHIKIKKYVYSQKNYKEFERSMKQLNQRWSIPGMSIAVIKNGVIEYYNSFGVKKLPLTEKVDENTIFDAASLTKPLFAYLIMQFVDKGIIELNKPIIHYLKGTTIMANYLKKFNYKINQPGFRYDWFSMITPRHILSHSAGLPHGETYGTQKPDVYPLFFKPGTQFKYSAEGYYILQKIIEKLTNKSLEVLVHKYVFAPLNMTNSYMVWREITANNAAFGHSVINLPTKKLRKATKPHAGGSLYTTAKDYAKFLAGVLNKKYLTDNAYKMMFNPVINIEKNISYAPGFSVEQSTNGMCFWHTGDYGTFRNFAYANAENKSGVVYLTNSFYGLAIYAKVIKLLFRGDFPILYCNFLKYYRNLEVYRKILTNVDGSIRYFSTSTFKKSSEFKKIEAKINHVAYAFMAAKKFNQAIKLCKYNTSSFPKSANAWDSLGEAYMKNGQNNKAIVSYKKSLELNPSNKNAIKMLKILEVKK